MAIKFNGGRGAITCDKCYIIIDQDLTEADYEMYSEEKNHYCMKCKVGDITKDAGGKQKEEV